MKHNLLITIVVTMLLGAYIIPISAAPDVQELGILSTKMVNLSSAVDTYCNNSLEAPNESDEVILINATKHDNSLLAKEFESYTLKVQCQKPYAVVLLCMKDGGEAIMEDAGCSARLDRQVTDSASCEFTLHVKQDCHVEGADPQ